MKNLANTSRGSAAVHGDDASMKPESAKNLGKRAGDSNLSSKAFSTAPWFDGWARQWQDGGGRVAREEGAPGWLREPRLKRTFQAG